MARIYRCLKFGCFVPFVAVPSTHGQTVPLQPTKATVVLFTPGGHWRGMAGKTNPFAGKAKTASNGSIFDGKDYVATLSHSRYLAIQVEAGKHIFSASRMGSHPEPKQSLTLDLQPGSIAYLALTTTVPSLVAGFAFAEISHASSATCKNFVADHLETSSKPVEKKQIADAYLNAVDSDFDASACSR